MKIHTKFRSENLKVRNHSGDMGVDEDNIRMNLREVG
jgi:hypothetical protein